MIIPGLDGVTRFEVIDRTGRALSRRPVQVDADLQDGGRTLKVFLTEDETETQRLIDVANRPSETEHAPTREELALYRHLALNEYIGLGVPDLTGYTPWLQHVLSQPDMGLISLIDTFDHVIRKLTGDTE